MRYIQLFILFLFTSAAFAQDVLRPLTANPDLFGDEDPWQTKALVNSFDSTFYYKTDTLSLPFFDEFSRNKFQNYDADFSDPNVTEQLFYKMRDENTSVPLAPDTKLTSTKTYRSEYDVAADTTIFYYLDSVRFEYNDLMSYAPNYASMYAYPGYIIYDTINGGSNSTDTVEVNNPEYVQDSARIFIVEINDPEKLWLNKQAYHNYRFADNPWSLGVVTFDGLDEHGYPYNFSTTTNGTADTLLSKPIDLSTNSPADSVYFSFLYQTEGLGYQPEESDSLYLEFYAPASQECKRVWRTEGGPNADFKVGHLAVDDLDYFQKGFQFRFINYGAIAGSLDHFHVDYVNLRPLSGVQDTLFKDFAMVYPISTLLKDYISVPWKHYRAHPTGKMGDEVKVTVRNVSELTENNQNGSVNVYYDNTLEGS